MRIFQVLMALVFLTGTAFAQDTTSSADDLIDDVAAGTADAGELDGNLDGNLDGGAVLPLIFSRDMLNEEGIVARQQSLTSYF